MKINFMNVINFSQKDSFSLVELMVVVMVFSIMVSSIFAVLDSGRRSWNVSEAQIDNQSEARRALGRMTDELTQAGQATVTINATQDVISSQVPTSYNDATATITWGDQIQYSLGGINGEQLLRTNLNTLAIEIIGNNITTLQFTSLAIDVVGIQLILTKQARSQDTLQLPLNSQVKLRN